MSLHDDLVAAAILAGVWLGCVALGMLLDGFGRLQLWANDPYEDHPKMSPSVQPAYTAYQSLTGM